MAKIDNLNIDKETLEKTLKEAKEFVDKTKKDISYFDDHLNVTLLYYYIISRMLAEKIQTLIYKNETVPASWVQLTKILPETINSFEDWRMTIQDKFRVGYEVERLNEKLEEIERMLKNL